jgi:hypothetical protein
MSLWKIAAEEYLMEAPTRGLQSSLNWQTRDAQICRGFMRPAMKYPWSLISEQAVKHINAQDSYSFKED